LSANTSTKQHWLVDLKIHKTWRPEEFSLACIHLAYPKTYNRSLIDLVLLGVWREQQEVSEPTREIGTVLRTVQQCVREVIGRELPPEQPLMEAGLDSLAALELRSSLGAAFKVDLPATVVFDFPTAASLSSFIVSRQSFAGIPLICSPVRYVE
jgi:acyl carrier protein